MFISNAKLENVKPIQSDNTAKPQKANNKRNSKQQLTETILKNEIREELQKSINDPVEGKPSTKKLYLGATAVALVMSCMFFCLYLPTIYYIDSAHKATVFMQRIGRSSSSIRMSWLAFQENLARRGEDRSAVLELYADQSNMAYSSNTELSTLILEFPPDLEKYKVVFNEVLFTDACKHLRSDSSKLGSLR